MIIPVNHDLKGKKSTSVKTKLAFLGQKAPNLKMDGSPGIPDDGNHPSLTVQPLVLGVQPLVLGVQPLVPTNHPF